MLAELYICFQPIHVKKLFHLLFLINSIIMMEWAPTSSAGSQNLHTPETIIKIIFWKDGFPDKLFLLLFYHWENAHYVDAHFIESKYLKLSHFELIFVQYRILYGVPHLQIKIRNSTGPISCSWADSTSAYDLEKLEDANEDGKLSQDPSLFNSSRFKQG